MSTRGKRPQGEWDDPERRLTQRATATHGGRVNQAGRDQYILTTGNAVWLTAPVAVAAALVLVIYMIVGRAAHASGSPAPTTGAAAEVQASKHSPLTVTLAYDQNHVANGQGSCVDWIFSRPLSAIPAPTGNVLDETWAHRFGGVDLGVTNFKLAVQGVSNAAVQLLGFRVVDLQRLPALRGTTIASSSGCGPAPDAGFQIALGAKPPVITPVAGLDNGEAKKIPFPFVVSSTDIQQFEVGAGDTVVPGARPCGCDFKWRLALDWSYEGKTGTTVIDDNGKPFQTFFPSRSSRETLWSDNSGVWKRI